MNRRNRCKAKLRLYPDPILKVVCEPVEDGEDVSDVIRDMMYILTNSKTGVGLAAPQAGHTKRVIIIKPQPYCPYTILINPSFVPVYQTKKRGQEGCLSYPERGQVIVERFTDILVVFTDDEGEACTKKHIDWSATIIQHEIDHLDGKCRVGE